MVNEADLIALLVFIVPMCFTPGPNNLLCAAHGSQHGFRATIPLSLGMLTGWSSLGLAVGVGTVFIEENESLFLGLTYIGAAYIAYLGWKVATSKPAEEAAQDTERLGFLTGLTLQVVNGKAWIHFLVMMTTWGALFGTGFTGKFLLVAINAIAGYPAVLTWAAFGVALRRLFSSPEKARILNGALGASLIAVAIWVAMPH